MPTRFAASGLVSDAAVEAVRREPSLGGEPMAADESVGSLVRRRFGDEVLEVLVEPLVGGINAGEADSLSVDAVVPQIATAARRSASLVEGLRAAAPTDATAAGPVFAAPAGGMGVLVEELVAGLAARGVDLRVGVAVTRIEPRGDGWVVAADDELAVDAIVVATPAPVAAGLVRPHAPVAADLLAGIDHASVVLLSLAVPTTSLPTMASSGFLVPRRAGLTITAASFTSTKWAHLADPDIAVVRVSCGHRDDPSPVDLADDELLGVVLRDLADGAGRSARPVRGPDLALPRRLPPVRRRPPRPRGRGRGRAPRSRTRRRGRRRGAAGPRRPGVHPAGPHGRAPGARRRQREAMTLPEGRWTRRGIAVLAGLAICFAMPPWGWWPLALVGVALWALLLDRPRWQERFWIGAFAGLGWFLPSTLWMVKFSPIGWPVGVAVWFPFLLGVASAVCPPDDKRFLALPATLILSEWVRWHAPFGGVPLSMLAMTQAQGPMLPMARIGGSLLVSAGVALAGGGLAALVARRPRTGVAMLAGVAIVAVLGVIAPSGHAVRPLRVAAVQGGGPQQTRSENTDYSVVFERHMQASAGIEEPVDLVVWPENVVNIDEYDGSYAQTQLQDLAVRLHTTVVAGIVEAGPDEGHFINAAVGIDPDGKEVGRYEKVRRVPFGEYVPLRNLLDPIAHDVLPPKDQVPGTEPNVLHTAAGRLGVVISWEVFFGRRTREAIHHGAQIILNPTNGSSYWLTQVQTQQIASSRLRAVESGRWLVQAAPTGFSAIVDPSGDVVARSDIGTQAVLQHTVELRDGDTIAAATGDMFALLAAGLLLAAAWASRLRSGRAVP